MHQTDVVGSSMARNKSIAAEDIPLFMKGIILSRPFMEYYTACKTTALTQLCRLLSDLRPSVSCEDQQTTCTRLMWMDHQWPETRVHDDIIVNDDVVMHSCQK